MTIFENVKFNNDFLLCSHLVGPRWGFVTCKGPKGWDMAEFCLRRTMVWAKAKPIRPLQYFGLTIQSLFGPGKQGKISI